MNKEKFIEINGNWLFSDKHFLLTERGWLKAKDIQNGDKVIAVKGNSIRCPNCNSLNYDYESCSDCGFDASEEDIY